MALVAATIALALLEYVVFVMLVGYARARYGVAAPATTGNEVFERYFRVQQNTVEQLVIFVPGMLIFGTYVSAHWAAGLGLVFIAGRALYAYGYIRDPKGRGAGFGLSFLPSMVLVVGGLAGAVLSLF